LIVVYLYGITEMTDAKLHGVSGIDKASVVEIRTGDLVAIVSSHPDEPVTTDADSLWEHEEVVEALMHSRSIVPARFGTVFASESSLVDAVRSASQELHDNLERVRGCVEYGLRVMEPFEGNNVTVDPPGSPPNGKAYMRSLLARNRVKEDRTARAKQLSEQLTFEKDVRDRRVVIAPSPRTLLSISYLVARVEEGSFVDRLNAAKQDSPISMLLTGPWPAYSFVSLRWAESSGGAR
jgi:hypothetical protein